MIIILSNRKRLYAYLSVFILFIAFTIGTIHHFNNKALMASSDVKNCYIAIVIDDFGNESEGTEEMMNLNIKFTGAVMPNMSKSATEAERLYKSDNDVILHMPMEAHTGKRSWLGPSPILNDMSGEEAKNIFDSCIENIKYCSGVNNHMGSKIMENEEILNVIFGDIKNRNLFFVDSMTTPKSKGKEIAEKYNINYIQRDVFLDSTNDVAQVERNMRKTGEIALKKGYAVAIGHVGAEGGKVTVQAIKNTYKELENKGIKFVTVSELFEILEKNKKN